MEQEEEPAANLQVDSILVISLLYPLLTPLCHAPLDFITPMFGLSRADLCSLHQFETSENQTDNLEQTYLRAVTAKARPGDQLMA